MFKKTSFFILFLLSISALFSIIFLKGKGSDLPIVAIANYGPHASLESAILGIKSALSEDGLIENQTVRYEITDVNFDAALIPQLMSKLRASHPKVLVTMTTPIAQFAKSSIQDIPLVYSVITDPLEAGLIPSKYQAAENMTGSSDQQDLTALLHFAKQMIPGIHRIGMLYATGESNDSALVKLMELAAKSNQMELIAIPVDQARDVPIAMQQFRDKVDMIYVGASGPIQPTLPVIASEGKKMGIPIFNVDEDAVKTGMVLASFGVDYYQVGINTGKLVAAILKGGNVSELIPIYPSRKTHHGFVSQKQANAFGLSIPKLDNLTIVE